MANDKVRAAIEAGYSMDEVREAANREYNKGLEAGYSRDEMNKYVNDTYGFNFAEDPTMARDGELINEWLGSNPEAEQEQDIKDQVNTLAQNEAKAQRASKIQEEWKQMDSSFLMRQGSRNYTDTELSDYDLYSVRDSVMYKANGTKIPADKLQDYRADKLGIRALTDADKARQDELIAEGTLVMPKTGPQLQAMSAYQKSVMNKDQELVPRNAVGLAEHLQAGFQMSTTGLAYRGTMPNLMANDKSTILDKIVMTAGGLAGDLPSFAVGSAVGSAVGGRAAPVTAMAGGMGLTDALREAMVQRYTKGEVKDFNDYVTRTSAVMLAGGKGMALGALGGAAGKVASSAAFNTAKSYGLSETASIAVAESAARPAAEITAFTYVGAAMNGHVPKAEDFITGAALFGLGRLGSLYTNKLNNIYVKHNMGPQSLVKWVKKDPGALEDFVSSNISEPKALGGGYRPIYSINASLSESGKSQYSKTGENKSGWMLLSKQEADRVSGDRNKANGFTEDGTLIRELKPGEVAPVIYKSEAFTIDSDAPILWFKSPSDPNIGRLFTEFVKDGGVTSKPLAVEVTANPKAMQQLGIKALNGLDTNFMEWLKTNPETNIVHGIRYLNKIHMLDESKLLPGSMLETATKSLAYSADSIANSMSVGQKVKSSTIAGAKQAYTHFIDRASALNEGVKVGELRPSYLAYRMLSGVDGVFLHWMEFGTTTFGKITAEGIKSTRNTYSRSLKEVFQVGADNGRALRKALTKADEDAIETMRSVVKSEDAKTVSEFKASLEAGRKDGSITKEEHDSALKSLQTLEDGGSSVAKYGSNDPLFMARIYALSKHVVSLSERGIHAGPDLAAAKAIANSPIFKKHMADFDTALREYTGALERYSYESGILSKKQYDDRALQNPNYVPLARVIDEFSERTSTGQYRLKGSDRTIIDPLELLIGQTQKVIQFAETNQVRRIVAEEFGTKLKTTQDPNTGPMITSLDKAIELEVGASGVKASNTITYLDKGIVTTAQLPENVFRAMKMLEPAGQNNVLIKLAAGLTSVNRAGIILNPGFTVGNALRDQISMAINSKQDVKPFFGFLRGLGSIAVRDKSGKLAKLIPNNDTYYAEWLRNSGAIANIVAQNRSYSQEMVNKLLKSHNTVNSYPATEAAIRHIANIINPITSAKTMYKGLQRAAEISDEGSRLAEYIANRKVGIAPIEAAYRSREITLDFARRGASTQALNAISLFLNAKIQGIDRAIRQGIHAPEETAARAMAYIGTPAVLLAMVRNDYLYNSPDSEVAKALRNVPDWQKSLYWIVPTDLGLIKIPKEQSFGIPVSAFIDSYIDYVYDKNLDKSILARFMEDGYAGQVGDNMMITPNAWMTAVTPTIVGAASSIVNNMDSFTRTPLIPPAQERLYPEARANRNTTQLAKQISYLMRSVDPNFNSPVLQRIRSPQSIDYAIGAITGTIGKDLWQLIDNMAQEAGIVNKVTKPAKALEDQWFVKSFMARYPSAGAKSITKFYEEHRNMEQARATIKQYVGRGTADDLDKARWVLMEAQVGNMSRVQTALGALSKQIRVTAESKQLSMEDKRQIIDGSYILMIDIAEYALKIIESTKRAAMEKKRQEQLKEGIE